MACAKSCDPNLNKDGLCPLFCVYVCSGVCKRYISFDPPYLPPPPPLPLQDADQLNHKKPISTSVIIMACMLGSVLLLGIFCIIIYYLKRNNSRRRNSPILFDTQAEFLDEDHGPEMGLPIWYINTVGIQQSVIDSITVCKYKRDEGLIEGTECSVCLGEFQEDESLRLLPKCCHAFHLPCIDTWLRSHKNCPLCRAPIVSDAAGARVSVADPTLIDSGSRVDSRVENSESSVVLDSHQVGEGGTSEVRVGDGNFDGSPPTDDGRTAENSKRFSLYSDAINNDSRVPSNVADNGRVGEEGMQPLRRSVSLDSYSASMICVAVACAIPDKHQGNSDTKLVQVKSSNSNSKNIAKRGGGNSSSSIYKLMKSSSIRRSLQKEPILMKRSFSSSGKFLSSRYCRSQESILPL